MYGITERELSEFVAIHLFATFTTEDITKAFKSFEDAPGVISVDRLKEAMMFHLPQGIALSEEEVSDMVNDAKPHCRDGMIHYERFASSITQHSSGKCNKWSIV